MVEGNVGGVTGAVSRKYVESIGMGIEMIFVETDAVAVVVDGDSDLSIITSTNAHTNSPVCASNEGKASFFVAPRHGAIGAELDLCTIEGFYPCAIDAIIAVGCTATCSSEEGSEEERFV